MTEFTIRTMTRNEFVEITDRVQQAISAGGVRDGLCVVHCPHTTAAITVNENADPDVVHDMLMYLNETIPQAQSGFRHAEGNSDSHIKASLVGPSVTLIVSDGRLVLGRWQGVYFCEFGRERVGLGYRWSANNLLGSLRTGSITLNQYRRPAARFATV